MVVVERKGCAGGGWLDAKEMWSGGCQSLVAILRGRVGSARRVLISGVMERPSGTGRVPFCVRVQSLWSHCGEEGRVVVSEVVLFSCNGWGTSGSRRSEPVHRDMAGMNGSEGWRARALSAAA